MRKRLSLAAIIFPLAVLAGDFKYHDVNATLASVDAKANTLTLTLNDGSTSSARVEGDALKQLAGLKAGDKLTVTCKDNENGEHLAVTAIKLNP